MGKIQGITPDPYSKIGSSGKLGVKNTAEKSLAAAIKKDPEAFAKLSGKLEPVNIDSKKAFKAIQDMIA
ncbi:hypothetical protein ACFL57_01880 [Candidatus Margulisiibacteriota bacterium]